MQYIRLFSGLEKRPPFIEMRLWNWIKQNWVNKTVRHISIDAGLMTVILAGIVWLGILIF